MSRKIKIDLIVDTICPWSFMGKRRLEQALKTVSEQGIPVEASIRYCPMLLPDERTVIGMPRAAGYAKMTGIPEGVEEETKRVDAEGAKTGIHFKATGGVISDSTNSHRLLEWAQSRPEADPDGKFVMKLLDSIYVSYWERAEDISQIDVLVQCAKEVGLDPDTVKSFLESDELERLTTTKAWANGQRAGREAPCFVIEGRIKVHGARDPELWVDLFERLAPQPASQS
ncbi:thioredoxin-like protein [Gonapodya prolifera JEL478]|uniref:Thioredoxin-like protein n=1 Tax=Gonapodya prolifera (strain JEL478) TaxID=1344416 RepID=A0A139ADW5_GONPJ|nr:thioredoxin-like protein [Gonapodya prolifera JEL478]|eukprot:KXS14859.1 thioredoxin-like protein [Gonapodya prolifera JEL478]